MTEHLPDESIPGSDDTASVASPAPAPPASPPTSPPAPQPDAVPTGGPRLRDRLFRLRSVVAVAAAGVIVGGAAGAGITSLVDGHGSGRAGIGHNGFGPGRGGFPGQQGQGMPGGGGFPGGRSGQGFPGQQGQQDQQGQGVPGQGSNGSSGSGATT